MLNELLLMTIGQQAPAQQPSIFGSMLPLLLMFAIFYFLLIRPQKKRQQEHQEMLKRLKKGDSVVTAGGVIGTIFALEDSVLTVEIADKTRIRVVRSQVNLYGADQAAGRLVGAVQIDLGAHDTDTGLVGDFNRQNAVFERKNCSNYATRRNDGVTFFETLQHLLVLLLPLLLWPNQ